MLQAETIDIIKRSASIPSMPIVATRCYEMTQDPDCDYAQLVELLTTDPGMAADLLRIANSPLLGVRRRIGSLKQAITLMGIKRIRELVLARYLVQKFGEMTCESLDIAYFWRRSLTTAILAPRFADCISPSQRDEAFVGGLLADVGVVVLARALPDAYGRIVSQYSPHGGDEWLQAEYNLLGITHGEVSALVLEQWNLPESIVDAVRYSDASAHEIPDDCNAVKLARLIGGAAAVSQVLCEETDAEAAIARSAAAFDRFDLEASVLTKSLAGIEQEIERMAELLHVELINQDVFAEFARNFAEHLAPVAAVA